MSISRLASTIKESPTLSLNEEARRLRAQGHPVIHLGIGEPKNPAPINALLSSSSKIKTLLKLHGYPQENITFLDRKIAIIENKSGVTTGIYITENNEIDENLISIPGYYKLTSPTETNYTINFIDLNEKVVHSIYDVTIKHGRYGIDIDSKETYHLVRKSDVLDIPLIVKNTGDFNDTINLNIKYLADGWHAILAKEKISLKPKKTINVTLQITPLKEHGCITGTLTVTATSEKDLGEFDEITFQLEILAPDLIIKKIKIYNEKGEERNALGEGEIVKIKAFFKNIGNENATTTSVYFYYDFINQDYFIGKKSYVSIGKYQKYPMIK